MLSITVLRLTTDLIVVVIIIII